MEYFLTWEIARLFNAPVYNISWRGEVVGVLPYSTEISTLRALRHRAQKIILPPPTTISHHKHIPLSRACERILKQIRIQEVVKAPPQKQRFDFTSGR